MRYLFALLLLLMATPSAAQTVTADRFQLKTGPCTLRSGSGSPEGAVVGKVCDTFWRTDTGQIYTKTSGTGNTGWTVPGGVSGSGTTNSLAKWTAASTIGNASITDDAATVTVMPTGNVIFNNGGDLVFNPTGNDVLPTTGYDINIGALTNKFLSLHAAELWVETLVAQNTMATIGGRILVAPTTLLTADLAAAATSMQVKHNNLFNGDRVYLEANGKVEFLAVTSGAGGGAGAYTYSITRNLDGGTADTWYAGDAILNTGTTGNGFIDLYSVSGVKTAIGGSSEIGPTIVGNVRNSPTFNDWSPRWAIGNLNGLYGYSGSTYGSAFGTPSGARVTIDATNGIRIYGGDNDEKVTIDTAGNAIFDGSVTVGSGTNVVRNSECSVGTDEWTVAHDTGQTPILAFNEGSGNYSLLSRSNTCYIYYSGTTPANNTVTQADSDFIPAKAGSVYEASVYVGVHRAKTAKVFIQFFNAAAALLSAPSGTICDVGGTPTTCTVGGTTLAAFVRGGVIATAPANTASMKISIQMVHNGTEASPYLFWVRSFLAEGKTYQTTLSEWTPAGLTEIIGGIIKTDTIDARTIAADTITANEIAANAITTSELNADSVTSAKIAANTIVAGDIAASTITTTEIAANTITAGDIAADTITASQIASSTITGGEIASTTITGGNIATNTITADKMNVGTLSAISANMGTLTAGTITGGTIDGAIIRAGTGDEVLLDSSGMTLTSGTAYQNAINWSDGSQILSNADTLVLSSQGEVQLFGSSSGVRLSYTSGAITIANFGGSGTARFVCHDNNGDLYSSGGTCDGSTPQPNAAALQQQIDLLKQELAALRAELAALRSPQRDHE